MWSRSFPILLVLSSLAAPSRADDSAPEPKMVVGSHYVGDLVVRPSSISMGALPSPENHQAPPSEPATIATCENDLIHVIKTIIAPQSWADMGGAGTIDYHAATLALVVNQTPDIQKQVADLLTALRKLADDEIAVEVRTLTIPENFGEQVGEPLRVLSRSLGFTGSLLQLCEALTGQSLKANCLNEMQLYLLLEAAQQDARTHITCAPTLTLFSGQNGTLDVHTTETFLTQIAMIPNGGNGNPIYVPQQEHIAVGWQLKVQGTVTLDRRCVKVALDSTMTRLAPGPVKTIPVPVPIFPTASDKAEDAKPVVLTQLLQQPHVETMKLSAKRQVADGCTVVLGGFKTEEEVSTGCTCPMLGKVPCVDDLFQHFTRHREPMRVFVLATARIVHSAEETSEKDQTATTAEPTEIASPGAAAPTSSAELPHEGCKTLHPLYIIEPPDTLLIEPIRLVPRQMDNPASPEDKWKMRGEHLVRPDGTVSLGSFGSVSVTGLTPSQAKAVIERYLSRWFLNPEISITVNGFNSKMYFVIIR